MDDWPLVMGLGEAVKERVGIKGAAGAAVTVIITSLFFMLPSAYLQNNSYLVFLVGLTVKESDLTACALSQVKSTGVANPLQLEASENQVRVED